VAAPGATDALSARLVEQAGFSACYVTGAGVSAGLLAYPDVGLLSFAEMRDQVRRITRAVSIPVIADVDTGYGNALNAMRTVQEFEAAGVAAVQIEDQSFPKRCGHLDGKEVIPAEEMVGKIRAAVEARRDPDFVIIARTDARANLGLDEAIRRARLYAEAGADVLFVEAPLGEAEMVRVAQEVKAPLLVNLGGEGKTPMLPLDRLFEIGYRIAIYPGDLQKASMFVMREVLDELKATGSTVGISDRMVSFRERFEILGLTRLQSLEKSYAATANVKSGSEEVKK
jgi:carboxyvinyl-carboxyphosphonate phosphorylmutase